MEGVKGRLTERIKRTPTIESFRFVSEKKVKFSPGQFAQLIFDEGELSDQGLSKYLSLSSSPTKEYIEVTKRLSNSKFSQRLKSLSLNDIVLFRLPMGICVFKDTYKKIAFLIGGIGITPVVSIIEYIIDKKLTTDVALFYSNRTEEEIAFKEELDYWQSTYTNINIFYTITNCQPRRPECIPGFIHKDLLVEKVRDWSERIVFIFGPPKMVETMEELCVEIGIIKEYMRTESFIGYGNN